MTETPYESEAVLQALLAQHPEILADSDAPDSSLLLIRREAPVTDAEDGGGRWSLDHLYVDARGVPTLVEVKRSSDTRGRREVVAQMLDYAANAKLSFSVERLSAWLEDDAEIRGTTGAAALLECLGVEDSELFWQTVAVNLDAERFRLVFVSDVIAPELRRIIEFLNSQMTQTEVLAIEVKQYVDTTGQQQTIVPRVIGDTAVSRQVKRARTGGAGIDRSALLRSLNDVSQDAAAAADEILSWAADQPLVAVSWSSAADIGVHSLSLPLLRLWSEGTIEVRLSTLRSADPAWSAPQIEELAVSFNAIDGVDLGSGRRWPRTKLATLADAHTRAAFLDVVDRVLRSLADNR